MSHAQDDLLPSQQHPWPGLAPLTERELHRRREWVFLILAGLFLGTLAMLNILGISRFILLYDTHRTISGVNLAFAVAVGVLPYPLTFLCTDFISELFGRKRASQVVWVGFMLNLWVVLILWLGSSAPGFMPNDPTTHMPPQPVWNDAKQAFEETGWTFFQIRNLAFGAVAASMIAYLTAQFVDVYVFHFWKKLTNGKHLWLRNNGSTLVSQLVDTTAVIIITHFYAHALPVNDANPIWPQLLVFIAGGYAFKAGAALLDTIPFYIGASFLAKYLRFPPPSGPPAPPAAAAVEAGVG
ncbi:MAG: queuosine precursor transporter [Phycisphaerales bacterium]|nr:queuosine precursor transporter [Phycisphaerales bacterium]